MKYIIRMGLNGKCVSPSMRREWIEIRLYISTSLYKPVSLHAEGVD